MNEKLLYQIHGEILFSSKISRIIKNIIMDIYDESLSEMAIDRDDPDIEFDADIELRNSRNELSKLRKLNLDSEVNKFKDHIKLIVISNFKNFDFIDSDSDTNNIKNILAISTSNLDVKEVPENGMKLDVKEVPENGMEKPINYKNIQKAKGQNNGK